MDLEMLDMDMLFVTNILIRIGVLIKVFFFVSCATVKLPNKGHANMLKDWDLAFVALSKVILRNVSFISEVPLYRDHSKTSCYREVTVCIAILKCLVIIFYFYPVNTYTN